MLLEATLPWPVREEMAKEMESGLRLAGFDSTIKVCKLCSVLRFFLPCRCHCHCLRDRLLSFAGVLGTGLRW